MIMETGTAQMGVLVGTGCPSLLPRAPGQVPAPLWPCVPGVRRVWSLLPMLRCRHVWGLLNPRHPQGPPPTSPPGVPPPHRHKRPLSPQNGRAGLRLPQGPRAVGSGSHAHRGLWGGSFAQPEG